MPETHSKALYRIGPDSGLVWSPPRHIKRPDAIDYDPRFNETVTNIVTGNLDDMEVLEPPAGQTAEKHFAALACAASNYYGIQSALLHERIALQSDESLHLALSGLAKLRNGLLLIASAERFMSSEEAERQSKLLQRLKDLDIPTAIINVSERSSRPFIAEKSLRIVTNTNQLRPQHVSTESKVAARV